MKVLIVGGGGREHALAWKAAQSPQVAQVFVAPGNAGSAREVGVENVAINTDGNIDGNINALSSVTALADFAENNNIDLTIVGPEAPLVAGIGDEFAARGLKCFAPTAAAAQLEGSKTFAKDFMHRHKIPTADYRSFDDADAARQFLQSQHYPLAIKADGLAAGKGVCIAENRAQAQAAIDDMLIANQFGDAGRRVVIESFLRGEEVSFICIIDGESILPLASSQDHKAAHDGDRGPNTGGMGAYSPAPLIDADMHAQIIDSVISPTVRGMLADGMPYRGFLYAGLMVGDDGIARVLEFNCRLGDPETQPILMRLQSDLVAHCLAACAGELDGETAKWDSRCALGVVMAADGYPRDYQTGAVIDGVDKDGANVKIFHAGTRLNENHQITVSGGRVLCITALADSVAAAAQSAYRRAQQIHWHGAWYRRDIGHRAIARAGV